MKKLLFLLLLLPSLVNGQFLNVGNTWQRQVVGTDTTYRMVMGGPGYWYPYTRKQIDNKFVWLTTNQTIAGNKTFTGETVTGLDAYSSDLTASFVTRSKIDKGYADGRYVNLTTTYSNPVFVNTLEWSKITSAPSFITAAQTYYIGTTSNALNRASGSQTLTGVSIDGNSATATLAANSTLWNNQVYNDALNANADYFLTSTGSGWNYSSKAQVQTALGISGGPFLPLTAGSGSPLSGTLYQATGNNTVVSQSNTATTGYQYHNMQSTGARLVWGIEASTSANILSGSTGNSGLIGTIGSNPFHIGTNGSVRYTIDASGNNTWTGTGTFGGALTGTSATFSGIGKFNGGTTTSAGLGNLGVLTTGEFMSVGASGGYFFENRSGGVTSTSNWYGWYASGAGAAAKVHLYNGASNILTIDGPTGALTAPSLVVSSTPTTATSNYDLVVRDNSGGVDDGKLKVIASTALPSIISTSATIDVPSLGPGTNYQTTVTFTGIADSDPIVIGLPVAVGTSGGAAELIFNVHYNTTNQIVFTVKNTSSAVTYDIGSATYKFKAIK